MKYAYASIQLVLRDDATPEQVTEALTDLCALSSTMDNLRCGGVIVAGNISVTPAIMSGKRYDS